MTMDQVVSSHFCVCVSCICHAAPTPRTRTYREPTGALPLSCGSGGSPHGVCSLLTGWHLSNPRHHHSAGSAAQFGRVHAGELGAQAKAVQLRAGVRAGAAGRRSGLGQRAEATLTRSCVCCGWERGGGLKEGANSEDL